jgi:hypothetical protein
LAAVALCIGSGALDFYRVCHLTGVPGVSLAWLMGRSNLMSVAGKQEDKEDGQMNGDESLSELDMRIAAIRENLNELIEQAAAYSGAADEERNADRIADQEAKLAALIEKRDALLDESGQA